MPLGQLDAAGSGEFRKPKIGPWEGGKGVVDDVFVKCPLYREIIWEI